MRHSKIDGVVDAVRYSPDGRISLVRMYERRGVVWSDQVLVNRKSLVDRLNTGKKIVIGARRQYLGSMFETGARVGLKNNHIVTEGMNSGRDQLGDVGVF